MSIYKEMYVKPFQKVSKTIEELQKVQQECEEMYMDTAQKPPIEISKRQEQEPNDP